MKTTQTLLAAVILGTSLFTATSAQAALVSALGGQVVNDTDRNITWLANANLAASNTFGVSGINPAGYMSWNTAQQWIGAMNTANYLGYSDWRLPTTLQPDASCNAQSSGGDYGENCTGGEMGHLFYTELGGVALQNIATTHNANYGLFQNVQSNGYWSGTEYAPDISAAWVFYTNVNSQSAYNKTNFLFASAVRLGQVAAVPEPSMAWLMLAGVGVIGVGRRWLVLR